MKNVKRTLLSISAMVVLGSAGATTAQSKNVTLWNGELQLTVPKTSGNAKKISSTLYSIQPTSKKMRVVLYASREPIRADEKSLTNAQLGASIKTLLESQGYKVTKFKTKSNTFTTNLAGNTKMPWRKVGTASVLGMAQFVRTSQGQLVGTFMLSDPKEWKKTSTRAYRTAVTKSKVK